MRFIRLFSSVALGFSAALLSAGALAADVNVRMLHVDQNPDTQEYERSDHSEPVEFRGRERAA